uniref:Uncharacterized protein n=1 Tax=Felis catus TaxID=9685 RepID=A0ABI7X168_FELCA
RHGGRRWLLGGRRPPARRCGAEPRCPDPPPALGAPTSGLPRAPALPGARGWSRGSWREPRARRGRARGPLPLPQVPSGALLAARAARSPPPARPGAPRQWAWLAEDKVRRPRGDAPVRLEGAERRRQRLGSVPPDRGAGLGQAPVRGRRRSGGGGGAVFSGRISPPGASLSAPASAAPPGRGPGEDGARGPGPHWPPAAGGPGAVEGSAGGRRRRRRRRWWWRLLLAAGREQLAAVLWLPLPGPLRAGVPVQAVREDRLLLLGPLCQLHLPLRPGLGGGPVPALPGQVQLPCESIIVFFPEAQGPKEFALQ